MQQPYWIVAAKVSQCFGAEIPLVGSVAEDAAKLELWKFNFWVPVECTISCHNSFHAANKTSWDTLSPSLYL